MSAPVFAAGRPRFALLLAFLLLLAACGADEQAPPGLDADEPEDVAEEPEAPEAEDEADPGVDDDPEVDTDAIRLGVVDSFTGPLSVFAEQVLSGAELRVEQANDAGGVLGREVALVVRDDQGEPHLGVAAAQELYLERNVDLLLGSTSSAVLLAVSEWAAETGNPYVGWNARTAIATEEQGHDNLVRIPSNTFMDARAMANYFAEQPYERWAIIAPDYEYGHSVSSLFQEQLQELKPDVTFVDTQFPSLGEVDFNPFGTAIMAQQPEILYAGLVGGDTITFIRQAGALGLFDEMEVVFLHGGASVLEPAGLEMPEGVLVGTNYDFAIDTPENHEYVEAYEEQFGEPPGDYSLIGYLSMELVIQAMEAAGTADREAVMQELRGLTVDSPAGEITIREVDGQASVGMFIGRTTSDPDLPERRVLEILDHVPGEENMRTPEEIEQLRGTG